VLLEPHSQPLSFFHRSRSSVANCHEDDRREALDVTRRLLMEARIKNMQAIIPDAWGPLLTLGKTLASSPVPEKTRGLLHIRTAQINGCAVCLDGHVAKSAETPQRLSAVAVWREAPFFSDAERAALGLAESITRLADQTERVPDAVWEEAKRHYDEKALGWLVFEVALANLFNRLNVATRQVAGTQRW
jgi:AhpD family alkylhydroperoxidase